MMYLWDSSQPKVSLCPGLQGSSLPTHTFLLSFSTKSTTDEEDKKGENSKMKTVLFQEGSVEV